MRRYEHGGDIYGRYDIQLDFSVNTNPLGMPESVKRAVSSHIGEFEHYPDPQCRALTAALAAQHCIEPDSVLCGNGAADLIFRICAALNPRNVLTLSPAFSEYERSASLFGGKILEFRLDEQNAFALTESILDALSPKVDMLFLCNPNNPTGRLANPALLRHIAKKCKQSGIYLVMDECFIDFSDGESMIPLLKTHPHLMILRAFTKLYAMAGLRLGYLLCADTKLLAEVGRFSQTWSVSVPAQTAGLMALWEIGWTEKTRRVVRKERVYMTEALTKLGLSVLPSDANFLLVKSTAPLYEPLQKRGILVRSCANFTGLGRQYIRIGVKTRNKNEALLSAISEVLNG